MKGKITAIIMIDLVFLLLLFISGGFSGGIGLLLRIFAYALPIAIGLAVISRTGGGGVLRLLPSGEGFLSVLPLLAPTVLVIGGISALTSLILSLFGAQNQTDLSSHLIVEIAEHALIPAFFEELLFRYIPLRLLLSHSKRGALLISAILFALGHVSLFQIPYALFAGLILGFVTLLSGSVLPAMILHFVNNTVSVLWMKYAPASHGVILAVLLVLLIPSLVFVIRGRKRYLEAISGATSGDIPWSLPEVWIFCGLCILISMIGLM